MKTLTTVALWGALVASAYAADPSALIKCSAINDSVLRLDCFDALAKVDQDKSDQEAKEKLAPEGDTGRWRTSIQQSKVDDSTTVILMSNSNETVSSRFNRSARPTLVLRCMENTTAAYLNFDGLHMADIQNYGRVTFRVDKKKAFVKGTDASTDSQSLGLWSGGTAIPFMKSLFGGEELLVQAMPYSESAVTFTLDISGLENAIKPLRTACKW